MLEAYDTAKYSRFSKILKKVGAIAVGAFSNISYQIEGLKTDF